MNVEGNETIRLPHISSTVHRLFRFVSYGATRLRSISLSLYLDSRLHWANMFTCNLRSQSDTCVHLFSVMPYNTFDSATMEAFAHQLLQHSRQSMKSHRNIATTLQPVSYTITDLPEQELYFEHCFVFPTHFSTVSVHYRAVTRSFTASLPLIIRT